MMSQEMSEATIALLAAQGRGEEVTLDDVLAECSAREIDDPDPVILCTLGKLRNVEHGLYRGNRPLCWHIDGWHDIGDREVIVQRSPEMADAFRLYCEVTGREPCRPAIVPELISFVPDGAPSRRKRRKH